MSGVGSTEPPRSGGGGRAGTGAGISAVIDAGEAELAYGNTRLRARRSRLLDPRRLQELLALDLDGLLAALAETAYRDELEAALHRARGVAAVHAAVRARLGHELESMRSFYGGAARALVDVQLSGHDVANLVTLVRGAVAGADPDGVVALLVPVGALDDATAREIARQADPAAAVELLRAWRLPTPADADALAAAWPAYERSQDLATLEAALVAAHDARVEAALAGAGPEAAPLRTALARERDDRAAVAALRAAADPTAATVEDELRRRRLLERMRLFATGDPLSIAIPVAYEAAVVAEARNLRAVAAAAASGEPADALALLVVPEESRS